MGETKWRSEPTDVEESADEFVVVLLELLSGNVREKLGGFMDPNLRYEYPLELAYSMAELAKRCVARDLNARP